MMKDGFAVSGLMEICFTLDLVHGRRCWTRTHIVLDDILHGDVHDTELVDLDSSLLALGAKAGAAGEGTVELALVTGSAFRSKP